MSSVFLDFVRVVVKGDIDRVSRALADAPALATTAAGVGATRQQAATFFFTDIAHYMYAGDTALHMAAAAFRRPVAELLVAYGADCRARNRRGAEPLHYAADANRWDSIAQADNDRLPYWWARSRRTGIVPARRRRRAVRTFVSGRASARGWRVIRDGPTGGINAAAPAVQTTGEVEAGLR
jgi:hypothetical protein